MATDYNQLYEESTLTLAKTLVIKSATSAGLVNDSLKLTYPNLKVDELDPTTWKYYLNLCGQYHLTDTVMQVISLDTLEVIDFTRENLEIHAATREAYQYGSRYYYALLNQYTEQEQLILGILYPCDMTAAVNSADYTILNYPTGLVEPQEITLVHELQEWMYRFAIRWDVQAFGVSDSLYAPAQHAIFYLQLPMKLFNLRLKRCKTSEAHSFHIRSYLASHSGLDKYYDYMTLEQALFLYRNISYIEHNAGKTDTFDWLMEKILTNRNIPIAEYQARLEGRFDDQYYPTYQFKKIPLNTEFNTPNQNYYSLDQLLAKEAPQAIGNSDYIQYDRDKIDHLFKNSTTSSLLTKNLESSMTDYTGNQVNPLSEILFNHWGWLAVNNRYRVAVNFKDPVTSGVHTLFTDDAFVYYLYILMMSINAEIVNLPSFVLKRVQKLVLPTLSELTQLTDTRLFPTTELPKWLLDNQPTLKACSSVSNFYNLGKRIFDAEQSHWYLISQTEHHVERAMVSAMCDALFEDIEVEFTDTGKPFLPWLKERSLPTEHYTTEQCQELLKNLFEAATGYTIDPTKAIGNIQKAMLSIMSDLSSYSIKFVQEINENPVKPLNWAAIRLGDVKSGVAGEVLTNERIEVIEQQIRLKQSAVFEITPEHFVEFSHTHLKPIQMDSEPSIEITVKNTAQDTIHVMTARIEHLSLNSVDRFENFSQLNTDQKAHLLDIYGSQLAVTAGTPTTQRPLSDAINKDTLHSLRYVGLTDTDIDINPN